MLKVLVSLEDLLALDPADDGSAYVGFTGATGDAFQEHLLAQWTFQPKLGAEVAPANLHCRRRVPSLLPAIETLTLGGVTPDADAAGCASPHLRMSCHPTTPERPVELL